MPFYAYCSVICILLKVFIFMPPRSRLRKLCSEKDKLDSGGDE